MLVIKTKLDPLKSVQEQAKRFRKEPPTLIHQYPGRISPLVSGLTTDQLPRVGNNAKATVKL